MMNLPPNALDVQEPIFTWPQDEGIWMGWLDDCWFPLKVKELKGDTEGHADFGRTIAIVAQFPESTTSWVYLFQGNHPVLRWRRPTEDELRRARQFYQIPDGFYAIYWAQVCPWPPEADSLTVPPKEVMEDAAQYFIWMADIIKRMQKHV